MQNNFGYKSYIDYLHTEWKKKLKIITSENSSFVSKKNPACLIDKKVLKNYKICLTKFENNVSGSLTLHLSDPILIY